MSLPGSGIGTSEQPTILEVINHQVNSSATTPETTAQTIHIQVPLDAEAKLSGDKLKTETELKTDVTDNNNAQAEVELQADLAASGNLVNSENNETTNISFSSVSEEQKVPSPQTATAATTESKTSDNVLDIESHLIETYDEYQTKDDSVGINELSPKHHELTQGTSILETDANVHSVIEVEPAGAKTKQPIATEFPAIQAHAKAKLNGKAETETVVKQQQEKQLNEQLIRETAEKLVNEIEKEVIETLSRQAAAAEVVDAAVAAATEFVAQVDNEKVANQINAATTPSEKTEQPQPTTELLNEIHTTLSQKVDEQLSEVTSILKANSNAKHEHAADVSLNLSGGVHGDSLHVDIDKPSNALKIVDVPSPKTLLDAEEKKLFIESLPQIESQTAAEKLAADCKREYYQSLKKYLVQGAADKPPLPLQTYRWEDLRRAKERGGYPWTHLYKRPLGPDEEPEIVLLLRKSQELRFTSESPKSLKKVRIDEQVLVKQTERYIQELSEDEEQHHHSASATHETDEENHSLYSESISCVSDSVLAVGSKKPRKSNRLAKIRGILKRRRSGRSTEDAQSLPGTSRNTSRHHSEENLTTQQQSQPELLVNGKSPEHKANRCYPIMKKLKSMADRQKKRLNIKRITLRKDEKIVLEDEPKILKLKSSPKSERGEIAKFIEKQDSDDVLEIMELDESPSRRHKDDGRDVEEKAVLPMNVEQQIAQESKKQSSLVAPDEVIEISKTETNNEPKAETAATTSNDSVDAALAPKKIPRLRREHVYEEITEGDTVEAQLNDILEIAAVDALKQSLAKQDNSALKHIEEAHKALPLDRMGSSEEEQVTATATAATTVENKTASSLLAPLSSIDSASSEEDRGVRTQLSPVSEESDVASNDGHDMVPLVIAQNEESVLRERKTSIKKESSPAPSDKKVTFSHVEDEAEPHREDIELPDDVIEATKAATKWKNMNNHEYEPIGVPSSEAQPSALAKEPSPAPDKMKTAVSALAKEIETLRDEMKEAEDLQKDLEERYFSSEATTPRTESRTDYEIHTSQVDSSALEELPLKPENRKKGFMASAQDRTRRMQAGFKNQAGKIKTKLRSPTKKPPSESPKAKERKRFKAPEFSKLKMPDIKRPDMSKLRDFKRPEFTKFNKPDMSKFKLPEKFSTLKLRRSKSFKENEPTAYDDEMSGVTPPESAVTAETAPQPAKKKFEFNFGTYPRAFRRKKQPVEPVVVASSFGTGTGTEDPSVIPSTATQPSMESSSSPQGDRGPGPVRSRWADKFSDVSYNDSEGSRYRRYGSEQESFDRESSLERRMKEDLEETGSEAAPDLGILAGVADTKQFAEFDEENRAIHEISNLRAGEFKRRPMVHQDSDLRSEDSKEAVGWTDKEIQKNKLLRKAELEAEASYLKYPSEEGLGQETQSTASSGKKVVMEEIDDDEFFLRKRGISEDNIELRQYISNAIREGYDMPINALQHVGSTSEEPMDYRDYDIPPPKPRRLHKHYRPEEVSQEFETQRSDYGDDLSMSQNGSDFFGAPKRPMRKGRSRSKYSMDSQDVPPTTADEHARREQYFDDDEEYLRPPRGAYKGADVDDDVDMNNLDFSHKQKYASEQDEVDDAAPQPQPPRRRKRNLRESSLDKDSYINGFSGRSVSNSYLQPTENVIVYRTEHEYHLPLATPENFTDGASAASRKSRSASRYDEDDRTSHGADSFALDANLRAEEYEPDETASDVHEKFIIDMLENDGYAVVRKEHMPKPTPPARRKKFSRSPGERFATMPNMRPRRNTPPPERPPPPRDYTPAAEQPVPPRRKSATLNVEAIQNYEDDYEEPELLEQERPDSPRNLQTGEIINRMKYRPLPPPPRPTRQKRQRGESRASTQDDHDEMITTSSTADSYDINGDFEDNIRYPEVEVSTQTDPLPDDFVCEEFEITDDMKVIEPRRPAKTLDELLRAAEREAEAEAERAQQMTEDEQLARGLQRFRDANQRSISERSRASSQADRSKSLSRPQTPSAVVTERRVSTPVPHQHNETMLEATLTVRPIDDLDLEEEELRREGLLTDDSQQSKSDLESRYLREEEDSKLAASDYSQVASSVEDALYLQGESERETERDDEEVERTMRDHGYDDEPVQHKMRDYGYEDEPAESKTSEYSYEAEPAEHKASEHSYEAESTEHKTSEYSYDDEAAELESEPVVLKMQDYGYEDESKVEKVSDYRYEPDTAELKDEPVVLKMRDYGYRDEAKEEKASDYSYEPETAQLEDESVVLKMRDYGYRDEAKVEKSSDQSYVHETVTEIEDEPVVLKMRDYGYDDERAERYSNHYDEDEKAAGQTQSQDEVDQAKLEKDIKEDVHEDPVKYDYERKKSVDREKTEDLDKFDDEIASEAPPQPPPRRKSTTAIEPASPTLTLVEQPPLIREVAPVQSLANPEHRAVPQLPSRLGELEVERLRVHALQAGQIMVSQLHGAQISSDELECKSGNLVVNSIELPPGFIENIVERVRSTERSQLYTAETQTSIEALPIEEAALPVREIVPPPKPPRHKDLEATPQTDMKAAALFTLERTSNSDEQTQTEPTEAPITPPIYPTAEYLQSLAPLAFYNLHRAEDERAGIEHAIQRCRHCYHRHHHHERCESSGSEVDNDNANAEQESRRHRSRSRSVRRPDSTQTVVQAGRQFLTACSLSLVNIINQLTNAIRGGANKNQDAEARVRQVPSLVVLFIVITFAVLIFLLTGRNVHTHHWDFFNLPGNAGRQS